MIHTIIFITIVTIAQNFDKKKVAGTVSNKAEKSSRLQKWYVRWYKLSKLIKQKAKLIIENRFVKSFVTKEINGTKQDKAINIKDVNMPPYKLSDDFQK